LHVLPTTEANFELVHLTSDDLVANKSTGNISSILSETIQPNFLVEQNNRVFLNDSVRGILVFDIYGAYYKTIPIKGLSQFQVSADQIIYFQDKSIRTYNFKNLTEEVIQVSDPSAISIRVEKERLYILTDKGVDIYMVKQ
jgi:ligand-binding sensor domain-containing protein